MNEMKRGERIDPAAAESVEPGGRAAAPGRLALVQRFVNTWNQEFPVERDRLGTSGAAIAWLGENGFEHVVAPRGSLTAGELASLRELREAVRAVAAANVTGSQDAAALDTINTAATAAPVVLEIDEVGHIHPESRSPGIPHIAGTLLSIIHEAQIVGDWDRLKGCRQCGYAFYDASKNRSATWCSMSICGNRVKNRAYHERRRDRGRA